jgi:hypothetical protein
MIKKRTAKAKKGHDPKMIKIEDRPKSPEERSHLLAETVLRPSVQAAATINDLNKGSGIDVMAFVDVLGEQIQRANSYNDLSRAEGMLITQAHTLDALFNTLARKSVANMGEYLPAAEIFMRLALKAQSQCRATLETLAEIKNPPVAFVRQQNIGENVQVNNTDTVNVPRTHARENKNPPNELLEHQDGEWLDVGAPRTAINADPHMATVGKIDGS